MKKSLIFLAVLLLFFNICASAKAGNATLTLSVQNSNFKIGDNFKVTININSGDNNLQIIRAKISYPADLLLAKDFALGELFPRKSPGESIGNGIIFTGGYRLENGTDANGVLGTVTFKVLKAGQAKIALVSGSNMITPEPIDIYSGGNSLSLTLTDKLAGQPAENTEITPIISSPTNPENTWSNNNNATVIWEKTKGCLGYHLNLISATQENAGEQIELPATDNTYSYQNLTDGIWTVQMQAQYPSGKSEIASYTLKIDTDPPLIIQPIIATTADNAENGYQLIFAATDALSGVKSYQIQFDNDAFKEAASPYILTSTEKNSKLAIIRAIDNAGNVANAVLAIESYIHDQEAKNLQLQQEKITLFDIKAESVSRSWLEFYIALVIIGLIFLTSIAWIIFKKRK
jgi:hypothetical protein